MIFGFLRETWRPRAVAVAFIMSWHENEDEDGADQAVARLAGFPGWPYSWVAALEPGRTSWTLPLDAVRLGPEDDATEVTAAQLRDVVARLIAAGHWREGDPDIIIVLDAGYDLTRLAWLLADLPVDVTGRLRSDRVMYFPAPPRPARPASTGGRRPRHGHKLAFDDPQTWPDPAVTKIGRAS